MSEPSAPTSDVPVDVPSFGAPLSGARASGASAFDAYVVAALWEREGAAFVLDDGSVRFAGGASAQAHEGSALAGVVHPSGEGVVTGGDDGRLVWSRPSGAQVLADLGGRWIDAVAASPATGLIACASGREVRVLDVADPAFSRTFAHERAAAALSFEPKGRRLAVATYGGAALWYARIADQKPTMLKWAGSHTGVWWSPDGRFVVTSMQENDLHGWRLSDAKDMRMAGYPTKVRSAVFLGKGVLMATAGAPGAVIWQFAGANGPMGKDAVEIGFERDAILTRVAGAPSGFRLCGGLNDGRIWTVDLQGQGREELKAERGAAISALAVSPDGLRLAWGDEAGGAGVLDLPA